MIIIFLYIIGGAIIGYLLAHFRANAKQTALLVENQSLKTEMSMLKTQLSANAEAQQKVQEAQRQQMENQRQQMLNQQQQLTNQQRQFEAQQKAFETQMQLMKEQMQTSAQSLLEQKATSLGTENSKQLDALLSPLRESIAGMKSAMESNRDTNNRNTASLEKAIEEVMKRTQIIGDEANHLARALKNDNKVQGNWGELILKEILQSQGLEEGKHYDTQVTMRDSQGRVLVNDDSGKRMIPDTILHYPDGKDVIIDSKVSLSAFADYCNAEEGDADNKDRALQRHLISVRQHIKELANKDYSSYIKAPRQSLPYVIMFIPNESALQLALYNDQSLWRDAFAKGVFITSEQNLIAALRMIQMAWVQTAQAQNQERIFDTARMLLDRVADFAKFMDEMGEKLEATKTSYRKAYDKLRDGRQSVIGASNTLIKLGAKSSSNKTVPPPLNDIE